MQLDIDLSTNVGTLVTSKSPCKASVASQINAPAPNPNNSHAEHGAGRAVARLVPRNPSTKEGVWKTRKGEHRHGLCQDSPAP